MGRPADWAPLADSDPVPGDPAGIATAAAHLSSVAEQIASQVSVLRKIAASHSDEHGHHAGKLQSAAADTAGQLDKVTGRYRQTAAALRGWVPELEYAQAQSLKALASAQDAAARQTANQAVMRPAGAKPTPAEKQADHARAHRLQQAADDLAGARSMLNDAVSHRDQAASVTKGRIESAISADSDSWWDSFSHWVTEHAEVIKKIADIASWVATACGVLSLLVGWIPVVGQILAVALDTIATLATAVALVCHLMLWVTGNGSWVDVALDVFALATLGMGRAFAKTAEEGYTAARAATRGPVARMFGKAGEGLGRSEVTSKAESLTGFTAKGAKGVVQDAKAGLKLPNWGAAALKGQSPVRMGKDLMESFKASGQWAGGGFRIGDAGMDAAAGQFAKVVHAMPKVEHLPSVTRWTGIADAAKARFYVSTGAGVGVDGFDKVSQLGSNLPGLHQYGEFKDSPAGSWPFPKADANSG